MRLPLGYGLVTSNACVRRTLKWTLCRHFSGTLQSASRDGRASVVDKNAYAHTLLLPKTIHKLFADPSKSATLRDRTCSSLYRAQWEKVENQLFVLLDGPPYANGNLHLGHAINKILKDMINRYHVLLGHRVYYHPGWDCHGLPIESKVLKKLQKRPQDLTPAVIRSEAEAFVREEIANQQAQFHEFGIMADWTPMSTYRTLDHDYEMRQLRIFQKMVEEGHIYRQLRPVYYSPSSCTALAEAELTYNEKHVSHSVYVAFELDPNSPNMSTALRTVVNGRQHVRFLVWTTTPWTLTANMGIAVNPDMLYKAVATSDEPDAPLDIFAAEREVALAENLEFMSSNIPLAEFKGSDLLGASYRPIFSSLDENASKTSLPVVSSTHVTSKTGTGLVHCAPAHGDEDYNLFRSLGWSSLSGPSSSAMLCHVDGLGQFTESVEDIVGAHAAKSLVGQDVLDDGGKTMVQLLKQAGALRKVQRIRHKYPYDWRTDKPVIVIATSQWFANTEHIKDDAIAALEDISAYPVGSHSTLQIYVRNRSEWCISRQRVWGVPIPSLYHIPSGRAVLDSESLTHILGVLQQKRTAYWWEGPVSEFVPPSLRDGMSDEQLEETWRKGTDTMDVWFDSGTSWSMLEELYSDGKQSISGRRFGADVCLEGTDQHRGWFQSQLLTAIAAAPTPERKRQAPYSTLITHGMILDEHGKKMSKSLGNVISPMTIINGGKNEKKEPAYGVEVLRMWAASVKYTEDVQISHALLRHCQRMYMKVRNVARFILGALQDQPCNEKLDQKQLSLADRYVMHELHKLEEVALKSYATYDFARVVSALSHFAITTLSSVYLDMIKDNLYANGIDSSERRVTIAVLAQVLDTIISVAAPILPFLAEEVHDILHGTEGTSVFNKKWTPLGAAWEDAAAERDMSNLLRVRAQVLAVLEDARRDKKLRSSLEADVSLIPPTDMSPEANSFVDLLRREEKLLETLCIVSEVSLGEAPSHSASWQYAGSVSLPGKDDSHQIVVRPAALHKCPRCWMYSRHEGDELCKRCSDVISS